MKRLLVAIMLTLTVSAMAGCSSQGNNSVQQPDVSSPAQLSVSEPEQKSSAEPELPTQLYARPDSCKINIDEKKLLSISTDTGAVPLSDLVFVCDDDSIAIVDSSGNVIGREEGDCVITASLRSKPASFVKINVTVKPAAVSSVVQQSVSEPSKQEETSTSNPQIIVIQPPQNYETSVSIPQNYTYTFGQDNFSYGRLSDGYVAYAMTNRWLTSSDVSRITENDAQILINTIYAKNGYHFSNPNIRNFFNSMAWYTDKGYDMNQVKTKFNSTDEHNMGLLLPIRGN